jgi:hypothetical protein
VEKRKSKGREIDDIVDTIIELPVKNLENKIKEIETEIIMRKSILNEALMSLGTRGFELEKKIWQMRYAGMFEFTFRTKTDLEKELARTEMRKTDEWVSYFRDVSRLKEELQNARENLALESEKQKLVKK